MTIFKLAAPKLEIKGNSLVLNGKPVAPSVKTVSGMRPVLLDRGAASGGKGSRKTYFMFRGIAGSANDARVFARHAVRFDITIITGARLGVELNKTFGHYHTMAPDGRGYPEVYGVLEGTAIFLMQKQLRNGLVDFVSVKCRAGDVVLMPPDYGHITINPGRGRLVLANLVSSAFKSRYGNIERMHGGAVYLLANGTQVPNLNYRKVKINSLGNLQKAPGLRGLKSRDMYAAFLKNPKRFAFLNRPSLLK